MSWFKDAKRRITHKFLEFVGVAESTRHDVMAKSKHRCCNQCSAVFGMVRWERAARRAPAGAHVLLLFAVPGWCSSRPAFKP